MSEKLVTKDLLKAFGDKSKQIFKPATGTVYTDGSLLGDVIAVLTNVKYNSSWNINIELDYTSIDESFGDVKFFGNTYIDSSNIIGRGILIGNSLLGVSFALDLNSGCLLLLFSSVGFVKSAAVSIVNYSGISTSNVLISDMRIIDSNTEQLLSINQDNTLGKLMDSQGKYLEGNVGSILDLSSANTFSFYLLLPGEYTADISGLKSKVSNGDYISKVNNSKWADYILQPYNITFKEGDLELFSIYFGGDIYTSTRMEGPKINNTVEGYEGYQEGDLVGRVRVNSKGLVTAVEKDPELPKATETTLGVIQVGYKENLIDKQYPVKLDADGNAYVHVPWNDTDTWNKVANSNDLGLIKIGYVENDKNYPVLLDSDNRAFVNVPWTDTKCEAATATLLGSIKVGYATTDKNYAVLLDDDGNAYVNVPLESNTYELATKDTAGLIKVGYTSNNSIKLPIKLDNSGNAYAEKNIDITAGYSPGDIYLSHLGSSDYNYILPSIDGIGKDHFSEDYLNQPWQTVTLFTVHVDKITLQQSHSAVKTIRIENPYELDSITVLIKKGDGVRICNMFDANITTTGVTLLPRQTIELVFTYWNYNNVTFNGGFSV